MTFLSEIQVKKLLGLLFLFLLPTQLGTFFFMNFSYIHGVRIDYLAPALYTTDIIFFALLIVFFRQIIAYIQAHSRETCVLCVLIAVSISLTMHQFWALYSVLKLIQIVCLFVIFSSIRLSSNEILTTFGLSSVVQLFLTLVQFAQKSSLQGAFYYIGERYMTVSTPGIAKASFFGEEILRPYGTFSHPNSLGGFFLLMYSFVMLMPSKSILKPIVLGLCAMLVLISFSKLAIFTFVIINIGYFIFHYSKKCTICTISRFTLLLVVAAIFLHTQSDPLSLQKRISLFTQGISVIKDNLLFGTGFGHHLYAQADFPSTYSYFFLQPVHNIFILFVMQAGVIVSGIIFFYLWKHLRKHAVQIRKYGGYMICVILLTGAGDHYWITLQQNMLLLGTLWGLMIGQNSSSQQ